ncbi:hypothetical protein D9M73_229790 [compost metagenome]
MPFNHRLHANRLIFPDVLPGQSDDRLKLSKRCARIRPGSSNIYGIGYWLDFAHRLLDLLHPMIVLPVERLQHLGARGVSLLHDVNAIDLNFFTNNAAPTVCLNYTMLAVAALVQTRLGWSRFGKL